jgi:hypothetical protein
MWVIVAGLVMGVLIAITFFFGALSSENTKVAIAIGAIFWVTLFVIAFAQSQKFDVNSAPTSNRPDLSHEEFMAGVSGLVHDTRKKR